MTLPAARISLGPDGPVLVTGARLPVEALVLGKPLAEVALLLPRLFNLCRDAQGRAARLALGLPDAGPDPAEEILRDHLLKLCITLPRAFGQAALPIPADARHLLGDGLPDRLETLTGWQSPVAGLARHIAGAFPPGAAVTGVLPPPPALAEGAYENSAAGRQSHHPLQVEVEARFGRGPLWRYLGLVADLRAALTGQLPAPSCTGGVAVVAAARGSYALRIAQSGGIVTGIARRTPTDHLLAPGGALLQSLASLPPALRHRAAQVIALHDPCIPVTVHEASHA